MVKEQLLEDLEELGAIIEDNESLYKNRVALINSYKDYFSLKFMKGKHSSPDGFLSEFVIKRSLIVDDFGIDEEKATKIVARHINRFSKGIEEKLLVFEFYGILEETLSKLNANLAFDSNIFYARIKRMQEVQGNKKINNISHLFYNEMKFMGKYGLNDFKLKAQYPLTKNTINLMNSKHIMLERAREFNKYNEEQEEKASKCEKVMVK